MSINLDPKSIRELCGKSDQVMVYGFEHCKYKQVPQALSGKDFSIKKVYDFNIGNPKSAAIAKTPKNEQIDQIAIEPNGKSGNRTITRICKAALVNWALLNLKREKQNQPLIPLLFFLDIDESDVPFESLDIASKHKKHNMKITNSELRRLYKICCELENDPVLKDVARIAKKACKFVKLERMLGPSNYSVVEMAPFWQEEGFKESWDKRTTASSQKENKQCPWRDQLRTKVIELEKNQSPSVFSILTRIFS